MANTSKHTTNRRGFTIVELLIVIVVIAILASITVVAYNGIQEQAQDIRRVSAMRSLQTALAMYYSDHGSYPVVCFDEAGAVQNETGTGLHCEIEHLRNALVPEYISTIPDMSMLPYHKRVFYASGSSGYVSSGFTMYAMAFRNGTDPVVSTSACRVTSPGLSPGQPGYSHFSPSGQAIESCY